MKVEVTQDGDSITSALLQFDGSEWRESKPSIGQFVWDVQPGKDGESIVIGPDDTLVKIR